MSNPLLVIVTGANRGLGRAICQNILSRPDLPSLKLLATSRKGEDLGLGSQSKQREILYPRLDISSPESINAFREEVKRLGNVGVLVNNAGINLDARYGPETVNETLDVNFRGTVEMCQTFMPHLSKTGRIVNMASVASALKVYSPTIQERSRNATEMSQLEALAQEFEAAVKSKNEVDAGFGHPVRAYAFSKALLRAATSILARQHQHAHPSSEALINCCCPGWIKTDMGKLVGRGNAPKTPEEGAKIPVRLAFDDISGTTGAYWANDTVRSRDLGKVQTPWQ